MKNILLILFIGFIFTNVYGQNTLLYNGSYGEGYGANKSFGFDTNAKRLVFSNGNISKAGSYIIIEEDGINYIVVLFDDRTWEKYLMLAGFGYCYLYNSDSDPFFAGTKLNPEYKTNFPFFSPKNISASSSLRSSNIIYSTECLDQRIGICWSEGVKGHGIGERIIINEQFRKSFNDGLYISIGYVSIQKPYLYRQNSRPKKIRTSINGQFATITEFDDTPNFQEVRLPDETHRATNGVLTYSGEIIMEILEVYPGTKYEDTCINNLSFFWSQ